MQCLDMVRPTSYPIGEFKNEKGHLETLCDGLICLYWQMNILTESSVCTHGIFACWGSCFLNRDFSTLAYIVFCFSLSPLFVLVHLLPLCSASNGVCHWIKAN